MDRFFSDGGAGDRSGNAGVTGPRQGSVRMARKEAVPMDLLVSQYIKEMKLVNGLNRQRIFEAWDVASGAGGYTVNKYLKNGVLYCSISSSVVRNQLSFQKTRILELMNDFLLKDALFVRDEGKTVFVKDVVLR